MLLGALLLAGQVLHAQTDTTATRSIDYRVVRDTTAAALADTTLQEKVDSSKASSVVENRDLTEYQMQSRYRPVNQPFHKGGFGANMSVVLTQSFYHQFADNYSFGSYLNLGLDKWFSEYHGMRIAVGVGRFKDNYPNPVIPLTIVGVRASYLFNVTAYVDGYDPNRLVEFYPMAGVGFTVHLDPQNGTSAGLSAHLGVGLNLHILPGVDLVVEPLLEIQKDARTLSRMDIWRKYLFAPQIGTGIRVALDKNHYGGDPGKNWYVQMAGGVQLQNSDIEWTRMSSITRALGPYGVLSVGREYSSIFGLRLSAGFGYHYWKEIKEGDTDVSGTPLQPARFRSTYGLLRLEGTMSLINLFSRSYDKGFNLAFTLGPEVGFMMKKDPYREDIRTLYSGLTMSLQPRVRIWRGLGLFLEPRVSIVPYSAYAWKHDIPMNRNYYDAVLSVSLGVEYKFGK